MATTGPDPNPTLGPILSGLKQAGREAGRLMWRSRGSPVRFLYAADFDEKLAFPEEKGLAAVLIFFIPALIATIWGSWLSMVVTGDRADSRRIQLFVLVWVLAWVSTSWLLHLRKGPQDRPIRAFGEVTIKIGRFLLTLILLVGGVFILISIFRGLPNQARGVADNGVKLLDCDFTRVPLDNRQELFWIRQTTPFAKEGRAFYATLVVELPESVTLPPDSVTWKAAFLVRNDGGKEDWITAIQQVLSAENGGRRLTYTFRLDSPREGDRIVILMIAGAKEGSNPVSYRAWIVKGRS